SLFFIAFLPVGLIGGLLLIAASWSFHLFLDEGAFLQVLAGFFMMIPFAILFSLPVSFFFHFAAESFMLLRPIED
ncbi:MAG: hypothetical protein HY324_00380, partial [Chlamydiia bacterium]|nr:hypothetical protein [Chlamydiia bacterium]